MVEKVTKLGSLKWLARVNVFCSNDFSPSNCLMGELVMERRNHVYYNTVFKQGQRKTSFLCNLMESTLFKRCRGNVLDEIQFKTGCYGSARAITKNETYCNCQMINIGTCFAHFLLISFQSRHHELSTCCQ